jgi:hypothetical protein
VGLALVKRLVRAQQGTITLASQPGRGTSVRVVLPAAGRDPGAAENVAAQRAVLHRLRLPDATASAPPVGTFRMIYGE